MSAIEDAVATYLTSRTPAIRLSTAKPWNVSMWNASLDIMKILRRQLTCTTTLTGAYKDGEVD